MDLPWLLFRVGNLYWRLVSACVYAPCFGSFGKRSLIRRPILIKNCKKMFVGSGCSFRDHARLEVVGTSEGARLEIGDGSTFEQGVHIVCHCRISIGKDVTVAPRCLILDTEHPLDVEQEGNIALKVVEEPSFVEIGDRAFLGTGVVVLPNVRIGKYCVVGANSVVSRSLPDYSICVGSPARAVKRYDHELKQWVKSD